MVERNQKLVPETRQDLDLTDGQLVVLNGPLRGATYRLTADKISIGRADGRQRIFPDIDLTAAEEGEQREEVSKRTVSRQHAEIFRRNNELFLRDLNSTNGTHLNGRRVPAEAVRIHSGDEIRVGDICLRLSSKSAELAGVAVPDIPPAPLQRSGFIPMVVAFAAAISLASSIIAVAWPDLGSRMRAAPDRLLGHWTSAACAAYPAACRAAMETRLTERIRQLQTTAANMADAQRRAESSLAEKDARLTAVTRSLGRLQNTREGHGFPLTVEGREFASPAALDGYIIELQATARRLTEERGEATRLRSELSARLAKVETFTRQARAQLDLLPVLAATRDMDSTLAEIDGTRARADDVLREVSEPPPMSGVR